MRISNNFVANAPIAALATKLLLIRIWATPPKAFSPLKLPQLAEIANLLLSGSAEPPIAIATAAPSNAFRTSELSDLTLLSRFVTRPSCAATEATLAMLADLSVARLPAPSDVTKLTGRVCAAKLAAD